MSHERFQATVAVHLFLFRGDEALLHRNVVPDDGDYAEDRWIVIGRVGPVVLVVAFTERNGGERIISARRAKRREEHTYYEELS